MKRTLLALAVVLLTGCGGGGAASSGDSGLASRDPSGARACDAMANAFKNKDDQDKAVQGALDAATAAKTATTASIKGAGIDLLGTAAVDAQKLHDACVAEGVTMPDVPNG